MLSCKGRAFYLRRTNWLLVICWDASYLMNRADFWVVVGHFGVEIGVRPEAIWAVPSVELLKMSGGVRVQLGELSETAGSEAGTLIYVTKHQRTILVEDNER